MHHQLIKEKKIRQYRISRQNHRLMPLIRSNLARFNRMLLCFLEFIDGGSSNTPAATRWH